MDPLEDDVHPFELSFPRAVLCRSRRATSSGKSAHARHRRTHSAPAGHCGGVEWSGDESDKQQKQKNKSSRDKLKPRCYSQIHPEERSCCLSRQTSSGGRTVTQSDFPDCVDPIDEVDMKNNEGNEIDNEQQRQSSLRSVSSEDGIARTVETMLRISREVETDFREDFEQLARAMTDHLLADNRGAPRDFNSFCEKMDHILSMPAVKRSLSTETPYRRILFTWLVSFQYAQRLGSAGRMVSRVMSFAMRYITSLFSSFKLLKKSSSVLSFCTGSTTGEDAPRSRLSSAGDTSIDDAAVYRSTFDLDLSGDSPPSRGTPGSDSIRRTSSNSENRRAFVYSWNRTQTERFSTSVDATGDTSNPAVSSANEFIRSALSSQSTGLSASSGAVSKNSNRRRDRDSANKSESDTSQSCRSHQHHHHHRRLGRKESDVDSAFCIEDEGISFSGSFSEHPSRSPPSRGVSFRRRHETSSVSSTDESAERARLAAIHRRRIVGLRGRLPSYNEDPSQLAATLVGLGVVGGGGMRDGGDPFGNEESDNEVESGDDDSSGEGFKSLYATFTLCVLAAIFISKKK